MIKVAVCGAKGKMGQEICATLLACSWTELVAKIDICADDVFKDIPSAQKHCDIDILVDFTQPLSIFENAKYCLNNGIKIVIGTTGLTDEQLNILESLSLSNNTGCFIAPNFSTGAVLMMKFAQMAAKYFDNAEIIEFHHNQKKDAPSGTSIKTAQMMSEQKDNFKLNNCAEKETITASRGGTSYSDIQIHSVRMPGFMASQEVILGAEGQILTIRHDSHNRKCYMDGILRAIKYLYENNNFTYGLDKIME